MAIVTWMTYIVVAFCVMPAVFRTRFGRWPFAVPLPPRNGYDLVEYLYGVLILVFTLATFADLPESATGAWLGALSVVLGMALQCWAVFALGRSWRIGQNPIDSTCRFVRKGPYRLLAHPIYVSMCVVSIGQALVMGWDWRSVSLVLGNLLYGFLQGRAESRRWRDSAA